MATLKQCDRCEKVTPQHLAQVQYLTLRDNTFDDNSVEAELCQNCGRDLKNFLRNQKIRPGGDRTQQSVVVINMEQMREWVASSGWNETAKKELLDAIEQFTWFEAI